MRFFGGFFGWYVVAGTFVLAILGYGIGLYGPPVFLHAVQSRTEIPLPWISGAVTAHFVSGAFMLYCLPALYRRIGVAAAIVGGIGLLSAGLVTWAHADGVVVLYGAALLTGTGWVCLGPAALNALIAPWFNTKRPFALSMAYNGASVGGVVFSTFWAVSIAMAGFPAAAGLVIGVLALVVLPLCATVFRMTPDRVGQVPDGDAGATTRSAAKPPGPPLPFRRLHFWTLAAGMALGLFAQVGLIAHLFSLLHGPLGGTLAGVAMSVATGCAILGRTAMGRFMPPHADRRFLAAFSYGVQIAGCVLLAMAPQSGDWLIWVGIVLFGAGIGNATSLPPLIAQKEFDPEQVATVVPRIIAVAQFSFAFAPAVFGALRQAADGIEVPEGIAVLFFAAALKLLAIGVFLLPGRLQQHQRRQPQERKEADNIGDGG